MLENEIARLRSENAALKKDILARGLPLPPAPCRNRRLVAQNSEPHNDRDCACRATSDLDRVVAIVGRVWHRFVEAVERAQKQIFNKS